MANILEMSLAIKMIKSLVIIITIGITAFFHTDLEAESLMYSRILPVIVLFSLFSLGFWFVALFHKHGINQSTDSNGSDSGGLGGFDGGDC